MSEPTDAERLIREARERAAATLALIVDKTVTIEDVFIYQLADALEAALAREQVAIALNDTRLDEILDLREESGELQSKVQAAIKERDKEKEFAANLLLSNQRCNNHIMALQEKNAKATEENRVLAKRVESLEIELRYINGQRHFPAIVEEAVARALAKPVGANDD